MKWVSLFFAQDPSTQSRTDIDELARNAIQLSSLPSVITRGASHTVQHANQPFLEMFERKCADIEGRALHEVVREPAFAELLERVYTHGTTECVRRVAYLREDGGAGAVTVIVCPLHDGTNVRGLLVQLVDRREAAQERPRLGASTEELKQVNEALVLAGLREQELAEGATRLFEEAQRATRAREDMLAIVSHDLRNPLGVILGSLEMLAVFKEIDEGTRSSKYIDKIRRSAEQMDLLIKDLVDVASLEAGALTIDPHVTAFLPLVVEAVDAVEPIASGKSIQLRTELAPELPDVMADPRRIQQVLSNLLGNALKFTPEGGTISVRLTRGPTEGEVQCAVMDTGPGLSPEDKARVFDRFWQARKTARLGSGLGLYIARGIIEAHGGKVWVESMPGAGSTFTFTTPVAPAA